MLVTNTFDIQPCIVLPETTRALTGWWTQFGQSATWSIFAQRILTLDLVCSASSHYLCLISPKALGRLPPLVGEILVVSMSLSFKNCLHSIRLLLHVLVKQFALIFLEILRRKSPSRELSMRRGWIRKFLLFPRTQNSALPRILSSRQFLPLPFRI